MAAANYTFFLNRLKINSKMSNGDYVDKDWVIFSVTFNGVQYVAPACAALSGGPAPQQAAANPFYVDGYIGLAKSGDELLLCSQPPSAGPFYGTVPAGTDLANGWSIGPLLIADEDALSVNYLITNLSFTDPSQMLSEALKVGGVVLAITGAALSAATAGISGVVGAILNGVLQLLSGIVGSKQKNCNGVVAISPGLVYTGAQLESIANSPVPNQQQNVTLFTEAFTNLGLSQPASGDCSVPNTDVTWSILRDTSPQDVFGTLPPAAPKKKKALATSSGPQDWAGTWGDGQYVNDSRITCVISGSGVGISGVSDQDRVSSYLAGLLDTIEQKPNVTSLMGQDPRSNRQGVFAIATIPTRPRTLLLGRSPVMPVSARYQADIAEHLGSAQGPLAVQLAPRSLVEIPMLALPFTGNIYAPLKPSEAVAVTGVLPSSQRASVGAAPSTISKSLNIAGLSTKATAANLQGEVLASAARANFVAITYAATLIASNNVSLQLYGLVDGSGNLVGHIIRYLRSDANGATVTDVMLSPVQSLPT